MATNHVTEKGTPQCIPSYKVCKEEYEYDKSIDISPFTILIKLNDFLGGIQHSVTVLGKWILDSNFLFSLPFTRGNMDYCCTNDNETKRN